MIRFHTPKGIDEETMMRALSCLINPYSGGFKWQIRKGGSLNDPLNNWILSYDENGIWQLFMRNQNHKNEEALKIVMEWRLGTKIIKE